MIKPILRRVFNRRYYPLNRIEIVAKNIRHNYKILSSLSPNIKIAPVLKSNAYGHGLVEAAKVLAPLLPPFFCVDSLYEAYELLNAGIKTPVLIMGFVDKRNLKIKKLPFSFAVYNYEHLLNMVETQPQAGIHLFVDTCMNREGIKIEEFSEFVKKIKRIDNLKIEGLMSHLAMADKANHPLTKLQVQNFTKSKELLESFGFKPKWTHLGASTGFLNRKLLGENNIGNLARVGIALYGHDVTGQTSVLKDALRLKSTLVQIKSLKKGESVGYDFTFKAKEKMILGILPIGYNDGINRRLSNKGYVKIGNNFCPIIGRVSMNITAIDLSKIPHPYLGQEVTVISENRKDLNSVEKIAEMTDRISYEVLVGLSPDIHREIIKD